MGSRAKLGGKTLPFSMDTAQWRFNVKTSRTRTLGGYVLQVIGTETTDVTLSGQFATHDQQLEWLAFLREAVRKTPDPEIGVPTVKPLRFEYFPDGRTRDEQYSWQVHIRSFTQAGSSKSVQRSNRVVAPRWNLTLLITEDDTSFAKVAQDRYIAKLADGFGWQQTKWNGPLTQQDMQQIIALGGGTLEDYLIDTYNLGGPDHLMDSGAGAPLPSSQTFSGADVLTMESVGQLVLRAGWSPNQVSTAIAIAWAESGGRPGAVGDEHLVDATWGPSYGLYQVRSIKAEKGKGSTRDGDRLRDPLFNVTSARKIYLDRGNWRPWSAYTNGSYRKYLDRARAAARKVGGS